MSLILDSTDSSLVNAIEAGDNEAVVSILEPRVLEGSASETESMLCGVLLLLPPLADYEAAANIFSGLLSKPCGFEAAVWDAYRYSVLLPDGDTSFERVLRARPDSAVSLHMQSMVSRMRGDYSAALVDNRKSIMARLFPFNLSEALKNDNDLNVETQKKYWRVICDLLVSRTAESDECAHTVEGLLQQYWDNLILGTRITSELWNEYQSTIGH
jgi:hypothetical protein